LFPCFLLFAHFFTLSNAATFEFRNQCPYTVWAAAVPGGGQRLDPGQSWTIQAPISCMFIFLLHHLFFLFLITFYFSKSIVQINKHFYLKVRTWLRISKNIILKKIYYFFLYSLSLSYTHKVSWRIQNILKPCLGTWLTMYSQKKFNELMLKINFKK